MVSHLALCQVPQRLLGRLIGCRFRDALLPFAFVHGGESVPPMSDCNLCHIGVLMFPTSQRGHIVDSRQLTAAFL